MSRGKKSPLSKQRSSNLSSSLYRNDAQYQVMSIERKQEFIKDAGTLVGQGLIVREYGILDNIMRLLKDHSPNDALEIITSYPVDEYISQTSIGTELVHLFNVLSPALPKSAQDDSFKEMEEAEYTHLMEDQETMLSVLKLKQQHFAPDWEQILAATKTYLTSQRGHSPEHWKLAKKNFKPANRAFKEAVKAFENQK